MRKALFKAVATLTAGLSVSTVAIADPLYLKCQYATGKYFEIKIYTDRVPAVTVSRMSGTETETQINEITISFSTKKDRSYGDLGCLRMYFEYEINRETGAFKTTTRRIDSKGCNYYEDPQTLAVENGVCEKTPPWPVLKF
jgi:hypothetical protein